MSKRRVCTTISSKHWELLKKYTVKFETQQKALEFALESLENGLKQSYATSLEEQLWMRIGRDIKSTCFVHKDFLKVLLGAVDFEQIEESITNQRIAEYLILCYYQKPLKKCSLKEILEGLIVITRTQNVADTINYTDDGNCYTLKIVHSMNLNTSKILKILADNLFRAYGVKTESEISENSLFTIIYKS